MSTYQQVLDHVRGYFIERMQDFNSRCQSGWGRFDDPESRCALGSFCQESFNAMYPYKRTLAKMLGELDVDSIPRHSFYGQIMQFNDLHSGYSKKCKLTIKEINEFLNGLAAKYNLNYKPINYLVTLKMNDNDKIKYYELVD